jgi:DNA-binding CsgD family transcriptional regulator
MHEPHEVLLTANEYDIVTRLLRNEKSPQIARDTKRSVHTVRTTIRVIYGKLDMHSVSQLSEAIARGDLIIRVKSESNETSFDLGSALIVLQKASNRTKGAIWPVKLHRNEIQALLNAGNAYTLLAATESNLSSLIDRVGHVVANAEHERPKLAVAFASVLGAQDRTIGIVRESPQIDRLAAVFADTPFPLRKGARSEVFDAFRSSYSSASSTPSDPGPSHDG